MAQSTATLPVLNGEDPSPVNNIVHSHTYPLAEPPDGEPFPMKLLRYKFRILRNLLARVAEGH